MGAYLSTPKTDKFSEDGENGILRYGLSSMQGWRATMEDAHAAFTDLDGSISFFGVYDGHGGKEVSRFCAKFLHEQILQDEAYLAGDLENSLRHAFLRIDEMMCERTGQKELEFLKGMEQQCNSRQTGTANGQEIFPHGQSASCERRGPSSGSTACVAILQNNQLIVANAGDSRCVLSRKGKALDLSKDHKPYLAVEKKRILEAGGFIQFGPLWARLTFFTFIFLLFSLRSSSQFCIAFLQILLFLYPIVARMSSCTVQSVAVAAGSVEVVCPKPRLLSLAAAGSFRWRFSHHQEDFDADAGNELLDILLPKKEVSCEKDQFFREIIASPPPYFSGSPPSRVSNPITQDARFGVEKFTPVSSPRGFPIKVRGSFGNKPAVRIEGFECLNGSVSAVA